jgi:hypothetical protein
MKNSMKIVVYLTKEGMNWIGKTGDYPTQWIGYKVKYNMEKKDVQRV